MNNPLQWFEVFCGKIEKFDFLGFRRNIDWPPPWRLDIFYEQPQKRQIKNHFYWVRSVNGKMKNRFVPFKAFPNCVKRILFGFAKMPFAPNKVRLKVFCVLLHVIRGLLEACTTTCLLINITKCFYTSRDILRLCGFWNIPVIVITAVLSNDINDLDMKLTTVICALFTRITYTLQCCSGKQTLD